MNVRPLTHQDRAGLIEVLTREPIPGQPVPTDDDITRTLEGSARIDSWFYEQLGARQILVAEDHGELLAGLAYGTTTNGIRDILWTAGEHQPEALKALVAAALDDWTGPARAWWYAPTVTSGLEGLPVRHRPNTDAALRAHGFTGRDLWSYQLLSELEAGPVTGTPWETTKGVTLDDHGNKVVEWEVALVSTEAPVTGALWWIEAESSARGKGWGRKALTEALNHLRTLGATQFILYVDDDAPAGSERDRTAAKALYSRFGFTEIDRLWSYQLGQLPED